MNGPGYRLERDPASPWAGLWVDADTNEPSPAYLAALRLAYFNGEINDPARRLQMPEQPDFEIKAGIPTAADHDHLAVPPWCDLVVGINRDGNGATILHMTRNAGESLLEAVHSALHPWASQSIIGTLWEDLDATTERLLDESAGEDDRGRAQGLAMALAVITNPYAPNVEAIKALALERAGVETEDETDEMWDELMPLGMIELRALASLHLPVRGDGSKWRSLGHDALVELLWQHDIGAEGKATVEPEDEDDWGTGL